MKISRKSFIESSFPVKEVSAESGKEKNIRSGNIASFHVWWARRPTTASRATIAASLIPDSENIEEWNSNKELISELSKWDNAHNKPLLDIAKRKILNNYENTPPKILDPFGGGGSIPLESMRLGCDTYSNELNPVAFLIQKCTIEYPQKYSKNISLDAFKNDRNYIEDQNYSSSFFKHNEVNPLLEDIRYWANQLFGNSKNELLSYYPIDKSKSKPIGYIWVRTLPCQNPLCKTEIPLLRQYWLVNKKSKKICLHPFENNSEVHFKILKLNDDSDLPNNFDPSKATVKGGVINCPLCGNIIDAKTTRKLFSENKSSQRLVAVILTNKKEKGKIYRLANEEDIKVYENATEILENKCNSFLNNHGFSPIPTEKIPLMSGVFNIPIYGIDEWSKLFNDRQKLGIVTFLEKYFELLIQIKRYHSEEYTKVLATYLTMIISRMLNRYSKLAYWYVPGEKIQPTYVRQALGMTWDYVELNPMSEASGGWKNNLKDILDVVSSVSSIDRPSNITNSDAKILPYADSYFDGVITDPPYYNSVPYADLSDYFYVWQKKFLGHLYPELFVSELSPKKNEITEMAGWDPKRYKDKDKKYFESNLKAAFLEFHRVLKPGGIFVVVYAHKTTEGWETLINSLLDSGLTISGAWPIRTEMSTRTRAKESAALASSIYIVARKIKKQSRGFYPQVKEELIEYLSSKLDKLWSEGISGADFFISAIGISIEVFGKYEDVIDYEGQTIRADKILEDVRVIVANFAVKKILHNGFASTISDLTRFYVLFRWQFANAKVIFDEVNKLAHGCHLDLSDYWNRKGFIRKDKEFISLLSPTERDFEDLRGSNELIDVLHLALKLWQINKKDEMYNLLNNTGFGKSDVFYRVAQAISGTLPTDNREKKLLDGFLVGRQTIQEKSSEKPDQSDLFE
ncbi:MAG: DUF1156 domain-containing protein [Melioribacteraceae bacterium]|nr:DUF1156 domain-containing protein [Melioribacteraceae bacterium]